jgi:hypothetical protein
MTHCEKNRLIKKGSKGKEKVNRSISYGVQRPIQIYDALIHVSFSSYSFMSETVSYTHLFCVEKHKTSHSGQRNITGDAERISKERTFFM